MKTLTKSRLTEDQIRALVTANFGDDAEMLSVSEQGGGMFNTACMLSVRAASGEMLELVIKASASPGSELLSYEKDAVRTEVEVNRLLGEQGIPVPKILRSDFSRRHIDRDYFFMEKLPGVTWFELNTSLSYENKQQLKEQLGRYTAAVHMIKNSRFGYPSPDGLYDCWRDAFLSMLENAVRDGQTRRFRLPYKEILAAITVKSALLDEVNESCLVDFDLWAGNILLTEKNGLYEIRGIVDFERAFYGDPYADLVSAMMIYDDVTRESSFLKGYADKSGREVALSDRDRTRMLMYRLYLSIVTAIETYRYPRGFSQYARSACRRQIAGDLAELKVRKG